MPFATEHEHEFHMEEYRQLRTEVGAQLARIEALLRYALVVSAAVYAWLLVQSVGLFGGTKPYACLRLPAQLAEIAWWIPPVFVLLAGLGAGITRWRVSQMGDYLKSLEVQMRGPNLGWEHYISTKASTMTCTGLAVWIVLLGATIFGSHQGFEIADDASHIACQQKSG